MPTPDELFAAAVHFHQQGHIAQAEQVYRQLLQRTPTHPDALCNLGVILAQSNRSAEAVEMYQAAIRVRPQHGDALYNLGNLLRRLGRLPEAAAAYEWARQCPNPPAAILFNLGNVQLQLNRRNEAIAAFREAIRLEPSDPRNHHYLALALSQAGRGGDGVAAAREALKLRPDYAEAHNTLGVCLESAGQPDEALEHFQEAARLRPDFAESWNNLGNAFTQAGRHLDAIAAFRRSLIARPHQSYVHSNLLLSLNYLSGIDPFDLLAEHRRWAGDHAANVMALPPRAVTFSDGQPIRLGLLSADFRIHPVATFLEPLLRHIDRTTAHVTAYANVAQPDTVTERLKPLADVWRPVFSMNDQELAEQIRRDGIDVLLDLGGHTAGNRLLTMARRPAPVQATVFGYPNTTGLPAVGYRISDPLADPPGENDGFYVEQLVRLPGLAWCWQPPSEAPEVNPSPSGETGIVTFGSFNNLAKVDEPVIEVWARILGAVPESRLRMLGGAGRMGRQRVEDLFVRLGVPRGRVEVLPRQPREAYYGLYQSVDIALDPFPYNGGVTTCDALWMGVPVITLVGQSYAARQGLALLSAIGLSDLAASHVDSYVEVASQLAENRERLQTLRAELRERVQSSVIVDHAGYGRNLIASLRQLVAEAAGA